jgi:MFS family permease
MFRAAVWIGLGVSAVAIGPDDPTLLLTVFFGVVLADAVGAGVGNIAFSETLARVMPAKLRGRARGFRGMAGAVFGGAVGLLIYRFVPEDADVRIFGVLFAVAGVCYAIGGFIFGTIVEPRMRVGRREGIGTRIREMLANRVYRLFLATQILLTPATQGLVFFTLLGRREFQLDLNALGLLIIIDALAPLAGNYLWGKWADRFGNRWALEVAAITSLVAPLAALALLLAGTSASHALALGTFGLIVFAIGVAYAGFDLASKNYVLELAPDEGSRPVYIGVNDTLLALPTTLFVAGGATIDWLGFTPVFVTIAIGSVAAIVLSHLMPRSLARESRRSRAGPRFQST